MSKPKQIRIFLAHANEDKASVTELYDRLKDKGYQPWLDKKDLIPGQNWRQEIPKAIKQSDIFIACLSKLSVAKQGYVQREFRMALNEYADKPPGTIYLIPLRLDECQIPELRQDEYGINLRDIHWLDYFDSDGFERLEQAILYQFGQLIEDTPQVAETIPEVHIPATPKKLEREPNILAEILSSIPSTPKELERKSDTFAEKSFTEKLPGNIDFEMIYITGGEFMMGSPAQEKGRYGDEGPQHLVTVPPFHMGKYPVTQAQWLAIASLNKIDRKLKLNPSSFKGDSHPVEQVDWNDAIEFCKRLSKRTGKDYRLPSEAEWEYACRAGTETAYSFGNSITPKQANFSRNLNQTTPVGNYPANNFGLHDMHGNVWEWCQDDGHMDYGGAPKDGSAWKVGGYITVRIIRGGSWYFTPRYCRSACRGSYYPVARSNLIGFRVVCRAPRALL